MPTVTVSAEPLRQILQALHGPPHHIRELQAIRGLSDCPITQLTNEYNAFVDAQSQKETSSENNG